ncbi:MAG: (2Fe-2S)-binding protein [Verrucomicrobiae bacterium]|nr:(2Fe-2S)-binding protein [Verrucomicrobiae bacterium]
MFTRRHEITNPVTLTVDGRPLTAQAGDTVAAAMLAAGVGSGPPGDWDGPFRRSAVGGQARAPYCLIGACFECLVEIDGMPNRQACLTLVRDGMAVRRQMGVGTAGLPEVQSAGSDAGEETS